MPILKHDRSHYAHLDSIDDETLERIAVAITAKVQPLLLTEPVEVILILPPPVPNTP